MTGLRAALSCSACCCERGIEVGPRDGEPAPLRAGLDGMDRVVSPPRARFWDKNLDLFDGLVAPRRPGVGNPTPSLMYFVLFYVNLSLQFPERLLTYFPASLHSPPQENSAMQQEQHPLQQFQIQAWNSSWHLS